MIEHVRQNWRNAGWAFLLAWVFCVFYSGSMDGMAASWQTGAFGVAVSVLPVAAAVAVIAALLLAERRWGGPAEHRAVAYGAPLAAAVGTPLLFLPALDGAAGCALFACAVALTSAGSGAMWIMWGEQYARLPQDEVELSAPASAVAAAVLSLAVMVAPPAAAAVLVSAFPLVSGVLFLLAWRREVPGALAGTEGAAGSAQPVALGTAFDAMGHTGFGILSACLFVCIEGSFWVAGPRDAAHGAWGIFAASIVFMVAVAATATAGPRRVSLSYAYRWMCPIMVAGFAALIVLDPDDGAYVAAAVSTAARFAFCLITQMYFAAYATRGAASPTQAYGLGWLFVHVGDLLGVLAAAALGSGIEAGAFSLADAAAVLAVLLVMSVMFTLNDGQRLFAGVPAEAVFPVGAPTAAGAHGEDAGKRVDAAETAAEAAAFAAQEPTAPGQPDSAAPDRLAARVALLAQAHKLTPRETEVFGLLAQGRSVPYIRDALFISRDTAATHTKHIYAKLDVHSRQELIDLVMSDEV